ncbi:ribosome-associated protein [Actinoalloteichus cyanogriseus DSM 43889]|uniref:Ribosome-associated protein n=2 Tax=Pseudonocardiaceae TaxID=2070 RepID=A0ABT1JN80_ACTCY|nr:ribosome-associated protein [Actinoalloteichus caeruleus DSM 43889]
MRGVAPGTGMMVGMDDVPIRDGSIRLGQFLKLADLASDGGDARDMLESGQVTVNDQPETRRGRQLAPGDVVAARGRTTRVVGPGA